MNDKGRGKQPKILDRKQKPSRAVSAAGNGCAKMSWKGGESYSKK